MDDFDLTTLNESRNEWVTRLLDILTPNISCGFYSIYNDALKLCIENEEDEKYLMTFQNFLTRIPHWNNELITNETNRIVENSKCNYIQDLIACVHIIQLKALTCIRVGYKQKQIDLDIPELDSFVHKVYIKIARKLYSQVYLFESEISPLQKQKHSKEIDQIIKSCILSCIRDSIPIEQILKNYLDESTEDELLEYELEKESEIASADIKEEIKETNEKNDADKNNTTSIDDTSNNKDKNKTKELEEKTSKELEEKTSKELEEKTSKESNEKKESSTININEESFDDRLKIHEEASGIKLDITPVNSEKKNLTFNNVDSFLTDNNVEEKVVVPKDINSLEKKYEENHKYDFMDDEDHDTLKIGEPINSKNIIEPISLNKNVIKKDTISLSGIEVL
jgi:hypothetical protein